MGSKRPRPTDCKTATSATSAPIWRRGTADSRVVANIQHRPGGTERAASAPTDRHREPDSFNPTSATSVPRGRHGEPEGKSHRPSGCKTATSAPTGQRGKQGGGVVASKPHKPGGTKRAVSTPTGEHGEPDSLKATSAISAPTDRHGQPDRDPKDAASAPAGGQGRPDSLEFRESYPRDGRCAIRPIRDYQLWHGHHINVCTATGSDIGSLRTRHVQGLGRAISTVRTVRADGPAVIRSHGNYTRCTSAGSEYSNAITPCCVIHTNMDGNRFPHEFHGILSIHDLFLFLFTRPAGTLMLRAPSADYVCVGRYGDSVGHVVVVCHPLAAEV